jgi:ABC-type Na+ transport system ATPase subunit NatA
MSLLRRGQAGAVAAIEVVSLTKRFGTVTAVRDLTFTAREGRVTGFLGPNGAGKSTTLRALLGLIRPTEGSARFDGRAYAELEAPSRRVGAILEDTAFHPGRTGRGHLRVLAAAGAHPRRRVDEVLELVELTGAADRRIKGYSLGMRQRLAIAAALLGDPAVLVLDEPANGLDPPGIRWLRELMRTQADEGRTGSGLQPPARGGGTGRRRRCGHRRRPASTRSLEEAFLELTGPQPPPALAPPLWAAAPERPAWELSARQRPRRSLGATSPDRRRNPCGAVRRRA